MGSSVATLQVCALLRRIEADREQLFLLHPGMLLMLLLSSGNAFGFLGGLMYMWCTPTARTEASAMRVTVLIATITWLLAALSCVGALLSLCVGLGLVLVIDADTHLTETYVGGWTVASYLVLPPPFVAACSLGCALKLSRLLHVVWGQGAPAPV